MKNEKGKGGNFRTVAPDSQLPATSLPKPRLKTEMLSSEAVNDLGPSLASCSSCLRVRLLHWVSLFHFSFFIFHSAFSHMLHAFDLHLHTYYSSDACASPEAMIEASKQRGLSGIAVTDHNTCDAVKHLIKEGLIRKDGTAVDGFLVVPGVEVSTAEGHLLCLGTTLPQMKGHPAIEVVAAIHERGGIAIAPHPFDSLRAGIREDVLDRLPLNALETFNSAVSMKSFNEKAAAYATRRGIAATAASDAHHASAAGICSTAYDLPELTLAALLAAIPLGGERIECYLPFAEAMKKNFGNWFRVFNPTPRGKVKS